MSLVLRPVHGFPVLPGWTLLHRLLRPVCPIHPAASQARLPCTGKEEWFLGTDSITCQGEKHQTHGFQYQIIYLCVRTILPDRFDIRRNVRLTAVV